ncbi:hypothetical protein J4E86_009401 [Alternaria arbusti]|uniref:uncharacterized protein n=1 Tax=Alternaria arbusti TaxID=232088 RepID=UPI0022200024|nr:uncharacterized protein J4E86_009401 [Alternaria arbusti]KAI4944343.1 hypothetical protein J4E86_009401 [Alternaria arbusti]
MRLLRKQHYGWRRHFLRVEEIRYVKVTIDKNKATDMSYPSLPPDDHRGYQYEPRPAIRKPPLPPKHLASAFHAMGMADRNDDDSTVMFRSLPRLTDTAKFHTLQGFKAEKEDVWGIAIVEGYSALGPLLVMCGFCIAMLIIFTLWATLSPNTCEKLSKEAIVAIISVIVALPGTIIPICMLIMSAQKHEDEVYILRGVIQPHIALDYAALNPWLRFMVRSTRRCYSIWRRCLSSVIPWFAFETSNRVLESHTASNSVSVHQNSSRSNGIPEGASGSSGHERPNNTNAGEGFVHGVDFSFRSLDNGEGGENNGDNNGNGGGTDEGDSNSNGSGDGNGNGNGLYTIDPQEPDLEAGHLYLHIIMGAGKSGKKQVAVEVTGIDNDYDLFSQLREAYRKRRPWSYPMLMVKSISPAQFRLFNHVDVGTVDHDDAAKTMPDIHNPPSEYEFSYLPREPVPEPPLLRPEQLLSLFYNPAKSIHMSPHGPVEYETQCYMRSPKRRGALVFTNNNGFPTGFGFEIEEELDKKFILACELLIIVVSILTAVLYIGLMKGDQKFGSAATIGGYIFVLLNFLYLCIIAATEKYRLWAY